MQVASIGHIVTIIFCVYIVDPEVCSGNILFISIKVTACMCVLMLWTLLASYNIRAITDSYTKQEYNIDDDVEMRIHIAIGQNFEGITNC